MVILYISVPFFSLISHWCALVGIIRFLARDREKKKTKPKTISMTTWKRRPVATSCGPAWVYQAEGQLQAIRDSHVNTRNIIYWIRGSYPPHKIMADEKHLGDGSMCTSNVYGFLSQFCSIHIQDGHCSLVARYACLTSRHRKPIKW